jgi:Chitobiase/beta-hexosaminidase C-terminal domain
MSDGLGGALVGRFELARGIWTTRRPSRLQGERHPVPANVEDFRRFQHRLALLISGPGIPLYPAFIGAVESSQPGLSMNSSARVRFYLAFAAALSLLASCDSGSNSTNSGTPSPVDTAATLAGTVSAPVFSPSGGNYSAIQAVTITSATDDAMIFYTTDGSVPTASSTKYASPVVVSASETLKAIAVKNGSATSSVGSAAYTLAESSQIGSAAPFAKLGIYRFGLSVDTLTVVFSEDLKAITPSQPWLEWGGGTRVGGPIVHRSVELKGNAAVFYLDADHGAWDGWDSLRLAVGPRSGSVSDLAGNTVGATSPWANIVYGIPPFLAFLFDPSGTGAGTNVRVTLVRKMPKAAVSAIGSFEFSWTNETAIGLDTRTAKVTDLAWDGDSSWAGKLSSPFALGQTACTGICSARAIAFDHSSRREPLFDSIPPSAIKARYRYSQDEAALDTLELDLSESWVGENPGNVTDPFVSVGKPGDSVDVRNFVAYARDGNKTLRMIVPSDFETILKVGDSARLAYLPQGSRIGDAFGNKVGIRSRWVDIDFGVRRLKDGP